MDLWGLIFIAIGIFSICGGFFNWDWFMEARKARFFVSIIGRNGARIFYGLLGIGLVVLGVLGMAGVIEFQ